MNPDLYQRRLSFAMAASLLIHFFLVWFYAATPLTQALARLLSRTVAVRQLPKDMLRRQAIRRPPPQLSFIEVDASQASAKAPEKAKFYSDRSSIAANPKPSNRSTDIPKIEGRKLPQLETSTVQLAAKSQPRPATPPPAPQSKPKPQTAPARVETPKAVAPPKPDEGITSPELQRRTQAQPQPATQPAPNASATAQPASQLKFAESSFGLRPAPGEMSPSQREIPTIASETDAGVARRGPTALNVVGMPQGAYSK